jgi:hypothetical protein
VWSAIGEESLLDLVAGLRRVAAAKD